MLFELYALFLFRRVLTLFLDKIEGLYDLKGSFSREVFLLKLSLLVGVL